MFCMLRVRADCPLQDERALRIVGWFCPNVFDAPFPFRAQKVKAKAVCCRVGFGKQACAKSDPLRRIDQAFKDGVLHTLPAVFAQPSYPTQTLLACLVSGAYVVAD